jgi:transposase
MDALAAAHDAAVQMIDTSIVRVHQHAATRYDKLAATYLAFIQLASIGYGCAFMSSRPLVE